MSHIQIFVEKEMVICHVHVFSEIFTQEIYFFKKNLKIIHFSD